MSKVEYTKRFLKELAQLPKDTQSRVEPIVFSELKSDNSFELGYLSKMKGYKDKYKIRVGDYRVGLTINKKNQTMICQRVALSY
jgi:mRNA interferase RelE/StbE